MNMYLILTLLITFSAVFAYINAKYIKMPFVIGLFFLSTVVALAVLGARYWFPQPHMDLKNLVEEMQLSKFILNILLGFLLFAGAMHTNWYHLKQQLKKISIFAGLGVLLSTFIVGTIFYYVCMLVTLEVPYIYCLIFGSLISPTDPIAVLGILTKAGVPKKLETVIVGESLFNDGVGVVLFVALLETITAGEGGFEIGKFGLLFLQEAGGGMLFGLLAGLLLHYLLKSVDQYETEVLLTLAFVMAGYSLCTYFHLSGPLAMVVMGLLTGNYKQDEAMSDLTMEYVHKFWEVLDAILNALLFILIALLLGVISFEPKYILIGVATVFIVLFARIVVVFVPRFFLPKVIDFTAKEARFMVWGGLRGGLSLALVLAMPAGEIRNLLLVVTYVVVVFSVLVQGLTVEKLATRLKQDT